MSDLSQKFQALNEALISRGLLDVLEELFPHGKKNGRYFSLGNVGGDPGGSLWVYLDDGHWTDSATGDKGGDVISLWAAHRDIRQGEAAKELAQKINLPWAEPAIPTKRKKPPKKPGQNRDNLKVISPVPEEEATVVPCMWKPELGDPAQYYAYRNEHGQLLGFRARYNTVKDNGEPDKEFRPWSYTEKGWKPLGLPKPWPFFGLENLLKIPPDAPILVVEGEKCALKLQALMGNVCIVLGIPGANSPANMDYAPLRKRSVIYWPDNDAPGFTAAIGFAKHAQSVAGSLHILRLPVGKPEKWDCFNAIVDDRWNKERIWGWIGANRLDPEEFAEYAASLFPELGEAGQEKEEADSNFIVIPESAPIDAMPESLQPLLQETAIAHGVNLTIPIFALFSLAGALVGRKRSITAKSGYVICGNLWLLLVANSGTGKSPVMRKFGAALGKLQKEAAAQYRKEVAVYEEALVAYQKKRKEGIEGERPEPPKWRIARISDTTEEGLVDILAQNPDGIQIYRDEISGFIKSMNRYSQGESGLRQLLLEGHDGEGHSVYRSSNQARCLSIDKAFVGLAGGVQPGVLREVLADKKLGAMSADGFWERTIFVIAQKERPQLWNETTISPTSMEVLERLTRTLWNWTYSPDDPSISLSAGAKARFIEFYNELEHEFFERQSPIFAKFKSNVLQVGLLLHSMEAALNGLDGFSPLSEDCMVRACRITRWMLEHTMKAWEICGGGKEQLNPIARAIMEVIVEMEGEIAGNGYRLANPVLRDGVSKKLGFTLSSARLAASCKKLNIPPGVSTGGRRERPISRELIESFRQTVASVASVANPHESRPKPATLQNLECCRLLHEGEVADFESGFCNSPQQSKNTTVALFNRVNAGKATAATVATVDREIGDFPVVDDDDAIEGYL